MLQLFGFLAGNLFRCTPPPRQDSFWLWPPWGGSRREAAHPPTTCVWTGVSFLGTTTFRRRFSLFCCCGKEGEDNNGGFSAADPHSGHHGNYASSDKDVARGVYRPSNTVRAEITPSMHILNLLYFLIGLLWIRARKRWNNYLSHPLTRSSTERKSWTCNGAFPQWS